MTHLLIEFSNLWVNHEVLRDVDLHQVTSKVRSFLQLRHMSQQPFKHWIYHRFISLYDASPKVIPRIHKWPLSWTQSCAYKLPNMPCSHYLKQLEFINCYCTYLFIQLLLHIFTYASIMLKQLIQQTVQPVHYIHKFTHNGLASMYIRTVYITPM